MAMSHDLSELMKAAKLPKLKGGFCPKIKMKGDDKRYSPGRAHTIWRYGLEMDAEIEEKIVAWMKGIISHLRRNL